MLAFLFALAMQVSPPPMPPAIPPATLDDTLEIGGDPLDAIRRAQRMVVDVSVNGAGPFRFVVDSGADRSVVGTALATRMGLPAAGVVRLHDTTGEARVGTVRIDTLRVGASEVADVVAPALPERFIGADGLLGIDALAGQRLMLDFARRTITVEDARRPAAAVAGEIVVTARRRKGQLILTQVRANASSAYAVIDTGSQITIGNMALRARLLGGRKPPPASPVIITSVTGRSVAAETLVLPAVQIGRIVLHDVTVAFTDAPPFALFGLDRQPAMLLGTDVLEAFARVSLDFERRKVRFVERR